MTDKLSFFQPVFGEKWAKLPEVFLRHYTIKVNSNETILAKGLISVNFNWLFKSLSPFISWLHIFPSYRAKNIPITVTYSSPPGSNAFCYDRVFYYPKRNIHFKSRQIILKKNILIELTKGNLGWKFSYDFVNGCVVLNHIGYIWRFYSLLIPLPLGFLLGKCNAIEKVLSEKSFSMQMQFTHPWFGVVYEYFGTFEIA